MKTSADNSHRAFRRALLRWYDSSRRDLPWRQSNDFYRVWVSEVMLQQTRVEAVIPYYLRFMERFPDVRTLAQAPEDEVLAAWSGLGYYSRARQLQRAAKQITRDGQHIASPATWDDVRALPGAGPYTAAAISSIVLGLPVAAVDGNVLRVLSRLGNDASEISAPVARRKFAEQASTLLDRRRPGDFNQAMMELGATICLPRTPSCEACPVTAFCLARAAGTERQLPVKRRKPEARDVPLDLLYLENPAAEGASASVFLVRRHSTERRLAGFWELPASSLFEHLQHRPVCAFSHRIVNDRFNVTVSVASWHAAFGKLPPGAWLDSSSLCRVPLTTITRKAIRAVRPETLPG